MKGSKQIAMESGLSKNRVRQFARSIGVPKIGEAYVWDEEQERLLYTRIGQRGRRFDKMKEDA